MVIDSKHQLTVLFIVFPGQRLLWAIFGRILNLPLDVPPTAMRHVTDLLRDASQWFSAWLRQLRESLA